jgi:dihydroorotate dehydrogenase electron transfer subunit
MVQLKAKIVYNKIVRGNYFHCAILAPAIARKAKPGQFVDIKVNDTLEPLLRRPFSIHRVDAKLVEVIYEVVGKGTEILSKKKTGDTLDVIGPLGSGFTFKKTTILVAGGMGVAPLIFLAEKLKEIPSLVLIGAKNKHKIICIKEFRKLGCQVKISTDDGSVGFKGKVTELLKKILPTMDYRVSTIYACGPRPMLKEISALSKKYNVPAQISLEEHMACGIGACLGCVVKTKDAYRRVCKEGPVFNADEIVWE